MKVDYTGEDQISKDVLENTLRRKKGKKAKSKRGKKKDCGCA